MTNFIALYRGDSVNTAKMVAVSADPILVAHIAANLLSDARTEPDPVLAELTNGKRNALRLIACEGKQGAANV